MNEYETDFLEVVITQIKFLQKWGFSKNIILNVFDEISERFGVFGSYDFFQALYEIREKILSGERIQ